VSTTRPLLMVVMVATVMTLPRIRVRLLVLMVVMVAAVVTPGRMAMVVPVVPVAVVLRVPMASAV
ncbi:hypothetical protein, partial [Mycobacterium sp. ACS4331]|uniref:hypothetical protein n=1 Tax=Mycobacterium sp. ACS4331 TaxID=1834121 RepID=UPI0018D2EFBA